MPEEPRKIDKGSTFSFSYSVEWIPTNKKYRERFDKYCDWPFFLHKVRYYSLINSCVLAVVLFLFAAYVMARFLSNDFRRFEREEDIVDYETEFFGERGWKAVHADVFRPPSKPSLLSALVSSGGQIVVTTAGFIIVSLLIRLHYKQNSVIKYAFIMYSLASIVGGYIDGGLFRRWGGKKWLLQLLLFSIIVPSIYTIYKIIVNVSATIAGCAASAHYKVLVVGFFVFALTALPLAVAGCVFGRHFFIIGENPGRTGLIRRSIPKQPWYLTTWALCIGIGLCGGGSIAVEVHYALSAVWKAKLYCVWSFPGIALAAAAVSVSCATIVGTYFRLCAENHEWHWSAFLAPASTAVPVFLICVRFYAGFIEHGGWLQAIHFFASSIAASLAVGIGFGFIGFISTALFVRLIFKSLKQD